MILRSMALHSECCTDWHCLESGQALTARTPSFFFSLLSEHSVMAYIPSHHIL